ncbi:hypothetical protein GCM10025869_02100 [Homoserinibacter gongjuensis]|uniref:Uncharacterized protein n=1 Tax=Homoserinibacter gongjuensis TaxID=1162968 RepID=A0ABQ6JN18_9MICO|nr:hypothetical protein GCM10025869_02100 [Homoserinibacter gongjuensis]
MEGGRRMARRNEPRLDAPKGIRTTFGFRSSGRDRFGRFTEAIARGMGTPWFLLGLSAFVLAWMTWNTFAPDGLQFDRADYGFIALTLVLSLQASYAAPSSCSPRTGRMTATGCRSSRIVSAPSATSPTPSTSRARSWRCGSR